MALWLYRHLGLKSKEVIVICANYAPPIPFGKVVPAFPEVHSGIMKKTLHFDIGKAFYGYVGKFIGDKPFTAYIDIMHTYQKLLVTHENCFSFHFMEEGTDSYMQAISLEDFTRTAVSEKFKTKSIKGLFNEIFRSSRGYTSGLHSLPYHAQSYQYNHNRNYFCLSDYCYPGVHNSQKVVIEPKLNKKESKLLASNISLNNVIIVIEETYPAQFGITKTEYKKVLSYALCQLNENNDKVYIKSRPSASGDSILTSILRDLDIAHEILPQQTLAEGLFLNSNNLKVVGFVSSLLFYAKLFGHHSYSMLSRLEERPSSRFDRINGFKNLVDDI